MLITFAIACALMESLFTALEVALGATSRTRLRAMLEAAEEALREPGEHKPPSRHIITRIERTLQVLDDAPRTTLLFITVTSLSLWTATSLLTWQSLLEEWPVWILPLALCGVLFLAEVLPVLIAAPRAESIALRGSRLVRGATQLLAPLLFVIGGAGRALARVFGAGDIAAPQVTEEELRTALAAAEEEGAIESGERALLEGAMDFRARLVREVMTPRREICAVAANTPLHEILRAAITDGHSRLPIYEGTLDRIIGIASSKDLIPHLRQGSTPGEGTITAREIARPAFFVPETKRIAPTLDELRRQRSLMALVVDDEGATVGLVTLEDLLEEIVGDIQDEYDTEEPELRVLDNEGVSCAGGVTVREFERFWAKHFGQEVALRDAEDVEADDTISVAALALHLFDGVPQAGDRALAGVLDPEDEQETPLLEIVIARMDGPRIEEVIIRRTAKGANESA